MRRKEEPLQGILLFYTPQFSGRKKNSRRFGDSASVSFLSVK